MDMFVGGGGESGRAGVWLCILKKKQKVKQDRWMQWENWSGKSPKYM